MAGLTALTATTGGVARPVQQTASDQTVPDQAVPPTNLDLPSNLQIFGKLDPNVRKPTAVVNDSVITGTDVDQRVALIAIANNATLTKDERDKLKLQVLRTLIDETLEIQEAKVEDVTVTTAQINDSYGRVAKNLNKTVAQFGPFLRANGSSDRSLKRQIEGELAWQRYLSRKISPTVNVGDTEVNAILERLKAQRGTDEYELHEIYLKAEPANQQQVFANVRQLIQQIEQGKITYDAAARQFSESSTRSTGGDLGWIKLSTLPDALATAAQQMQVGQIAGPVDTPGGFSILYLADKRQVGAADARDAVLSLKQLTVRFPAGIAPQEAASRASGFGKSIQALQGCGTVEKVAAQLNAEVVDNDAVRVRDLPVQLQEIMLKLQVGQATPAFGSPEQGVRALVLCGRSDAKAAELPRPDQVQNQLEESRVNLRAQQKLRDLRRDAVIEYR
ncbi:peptidylprolyl isomerase [Sphingomonas bacterium]|uniref:peptidylprolyl isomerase n=1 Tax=Sphingomonas bacterium TaxID=1895847 RepID=UPI0020C62F2D|nr:peptidylprolyl isomerase [Sphingomonas bacterium]